MEDSSHGQHRSSKSINHPAAVSFAANNNNNNLPEQVFGWNPFAHDGRDPSKIQPMPQWATSNHEILQLSDLYQQQLAELVAAHNLLMDDQESFAAMLAPLINREDGSFLRPPDEQTILLKRGLDLRLLEFEEDCRRIQKTERRLQRKIDDCTLTYETSLIEARGYAETRLLEQIKQQQKIIQYQQHELDELRFQRDLYSDETLRLRQLCRFGDFRQPDIPGATTTYISRSPLPSPRTLHKEYSGSTPPFAWMRQIRHSRRDRANKTDTQQHTSIPSLKPTRQRTSRQPPDRPFKTTPQSAPMESKELRSPTSQAPTKETQSSALPSQFLGALGNAVFGKHTLSTSSLQPALSDNESISASPPPMFDNDQMASSVSHRSRQSSSSSSNDQYVPSPRSQLKQPLPPEKRLSGIGLAIGTRQLSNISSRRSISSPHKLLPSQTLKPRTISSPRPTTLTELSDGPPLNRDAVTTFL